MVSAGIGKLKNQNGEGMGKKAIEIQNLTKFYGKNRGVKNLSLEVEEGDIFGYLGPNGAGKSTTIRCMLGLTRFQEGEIRILGMDARTDSVEILKQVGYMPSEAQFYPEMRVKDVIRYAADARGLDCREEAGMICDRLQVDLSKKIEELSLGNRKKVSIVCAMQHRPKLFVFDEPTSGLDPLMQAEFFRLILEYHEKGTTCLLSSHVLSEVRKYCNRAAIIREGEVIRQDTVEKLMGTQAKQIRMVKDGREEAFLYRGEINDLIRDLAGHDVKELLIEEPELENIFMHFYDARVEGSKIE